jgi:hypothetical protein
MNRSLITGAKRAGRARAASVLARRLISDIKRQSPSWITSSPEAGTSRQFFSDCPDG